jgi:uridine kinase
LAFSIFCKIAKNKTGSGCGLKLSLLLSSGCCSASDCYYKTRRIKTSSPAKDILKSQKTETEIFLFQKQLEEILQKSNLKISSFEFREVIDRYISFTLSKGCENTKTTTEKEIFWVANNRNVEIGAIV